MRPTASPSSDDALNVLLESARRGDHAAFRQLAERHRRELQLHCYRMLGSIHDGEDAVQETLLRAWRGLGEFEGRSSLRNWLYKIATNICLNGLAARQRTARLLPQNTGPPAQSLPQEPATEIAWLDPYPDESLDDVDAVAPGPEARYEMHEAVQLAFVAAVQQLPPLQRTVLLLRDVLGWSAAEAAQLLDTSVASITSAVQRARTTMEMHYGSMERPTQRPDVQEQALLDRYVEAWENADLEGFVALLREDAVLSMPPYREWFSGREAIRDFFAWSWKRYGGRDAFRLIRTTANRQPAFALYSRNRSTGDYLAHSIQVLTLRQGGIAVLTNFKNARLFDSFGLPPRLGLEDIGRK